MEQRNSRSRSRADKRLRKEWVQKFSTQKTANFENLFPVKTDEDKNKHYILNFDSKNIEKQIIEEQKARNNRPIKGEKFFVQLNFSFFHKKHHKFYGRTFTTNKVLGKYDLGRFHVRSVIEEAYFYTKVVNKNIFLIIDVLIVRSKPDRDDKFYSGGYFIVDLFQELNSPKTIVYYSEGTPRELLVTDKLETLLQDAHIEKSTIVEINKVKNRRQIEIYDQITKTIPPHTLIGKDDVIPGVRNIMDVMADRDIAQFRDTLFLHQLRIEVTKNWEAQFMDELGIIISKKYDTIISNTREAIKIYERKLIIQVHNTWTVVDTQPINLKYNKAGDELESSSIVKLENVLLDPYIALIFLLEYHIKVKVGRSQGENLDVKVGYCIVMPESGKSSFKKSSIVSHLQTGPKLYLDGTTLWTPKPLAVEDGKALDIDFKLKGIAAPTESLRRIKEEDKEESK